MSAAPGGVRSGVAFELSEDQRTVDAAEGEVVGHDVGGVDSPAFPLNVVQWRAEGVDVLQVQGRVEPAKPVSQKKTAAKPSRAMKKTAQQKPQKVHTEEPRPAQEPQHKLTDRERISLEQFERR